MSRPEPAFNLLLVCTGNICRSALAERLGRAHLQEVLGEDARRVRLTSAGVRAVVGSQMHPYSAMVLASLGGDPAGFRARRLVADMVMEADLVLTMTLDHRRQVLELAPRALSRTFTLKEAADLVSLLGEEGEVADEDHPTRARTLVSQVSTVRFRRRTTTADDVRDPVSLPLEVHQQVGETIAETFLPLLTRIAGLGPGPQGSASQGVA